LALTDIFSGSDEAQAAAAQNAALLNAYGGIAGNAYNQYQTGALNALGQGYTNAVNALNQGQAGALGAYGNVTLDPLQQALLVQQGVSTAPLISAVNTLQQAASRSALAGRAGVQAYTPLAALGQSYDPAVQAYYDALGLNGPAAQAQAQQNFVLSPGVQGSINQATQQALNSASAAGITASGNTLNSIADIARTKSLNDYYTNYLNQIGQFVPYQQQAVTGAAQGTAGANQALASILNTGAGQVAGGQSTLFGGAQSAAGNVAQAYGNLFGGANTIAGNTAGVYNAYSPQYAQYGYQQGTDVGNVLGNVAAGTSQTAQNIAQGNIASNNLVAAQGAQDASNLFGLAGAAVGAGAKALGPGGAYGQPVTYQFKPTG
jgi:hypothetical protein